MALPAGMQTAADAPGLLQFWGVEIDLPASPELAAKTLRLLDGAAVIAWGGNTWLGADGDYGTWAGFDNIAEAIATQSSNTQLTFLSLTDAVVQQFGQPASQMAPIVLYYGYLNPVTGQPVTDPIPYRYGVLNTAKRNVGMNSADVIVDMVPYFEFLFLGTPGAKMNAGFHQTFFPGETGFAFVDNVQHQIPWGAAGPRPDQVTDARNYDTDPGPDQPSLKW